MTFDCLYLHDKYEIHTSSIHFHPHKTQISHFPSLDQMEKLRNWIYNRIREIRFTCLIFIFVEHFCESCRFPQQMFTRKIFIHCNWNWNGIYGNDNYRFSVVSMPIFGKCINFCFSNSTSRIASIGIACYALWKSVRCSRLASFRFSVHYKNFGYWTIRLNEVTIKIHSIGKKVVFVTNVHQMQLTN